MADNNYDRTMERTNGTTYGSRVLEGQRLEPREMPHRTLEPRKLPHRSLEPIVLGQFVLRPQTTQEYPLD